MKQMIIKKSFSIKADKDSTKSKIWNLELTIPEGTTEKDLAWAVMSNEVVKVQNANRPKYDKLPNGHVFKKTFQKPGVQADPEAEILARAQADPEYLAK